MTDPMPQDSYESVRERVREALRESALLSYQPVCPRCESPCPICLLEDLEQAVGGLRGTVQAIWHDLETRR